jgi:hypothetical protein
MGRLNYRRIDSVSPLLFRHTLLSYPHVMPHGRVYKAQGHPFKDIYLPHYLAIHPTLYVSNTRESPCNPPHQVLTPGCRVLRISKRPKPVHNCPLFLVHLARIIELQSVTPSYSKKHLEGQPRVRGRTQNTDNQVRDARPSRAMMKDLAIVASSPPDDATAT